MNRLPSEASAVLACIDPDAYTAAAYSTGWVSLALFRRYQAIIMAGDLGASATINAKLTAATSSAGAGPVDITGAAITALTQASADDNKQAIINLNTDALAGSGYTHFRLTMTVGTATSDAGAILLGFDPLYSPASDNDSSVVDSITSV